MSEVQLAVTAESISTVNMTGVQQFPVTMQVVPSHIIQQQQPQIQQQQELQQPQIHMITSPNEVPHHIMQNQQQQPQSQPQIASLQNPVPVHLTYSTQVAMNTQVQQQQQQPVHQQTVTYPVQVAINPPVINTSTSAEPSTSANASKPRKGKKQMSHTKRSQQQTTVPKKRVLQSHTPNLEGNASAEKPAAKKRKRLKVKPEKPAGRKCGLKQKGKHTRAVQTQQSKEELMMELSLTVKAKLKEHVNTMDAKQMKEALHRIAELQPGLVFDVVVGQLAAQRREIEKRDITPEQTVNYDEITMKRSGKGYIILGHLYEGDRHDKEKGRIYLKCHKVKSGCKARARITGNNAIVMKKKHNHDPPNIIEMRFWNKAREEATKEEHRKTPMAKVYHIAKSAFLAEAKDEEERALWTAKIPSFKSVESGMRLKKSKVFTAPPNISMLDMTFDTLRDQIMSGSEDGVSSYGTAATQMNRDNIMEINSHIDIVQSSTVQIPMNNSQDNNMQISRSESQDDTSTNSAFHGSMPVHNDAQDMQMSNGQQVGGNTTAVQSLLAISDQLQQL